MAEVANPSPQVALFTVTVNGTPVDVQFTVEGLKYFQQIVEELADHEARLVAGGL